MKPIEHVLITTNMAETLRCLNSWFVEHESITREEFMELQLLVWKQTKKSFSLQKGKLNQKIPHKK